jgi:hypothetical protein
MAYDLQSGSNSLRGEVIDSMVKQIAERTYKFKQAVAVESTSDWSQVFFRENPTVLTGATGNLTRGIPIGANFPQASVSFEKVNVRIVKFGLEENIPWENIISGNVNVQSRTVIRLTEGVVKGVDDEIWDGLTESRARVPALIQTFTLGGATTATGHWDEASAAIIQDVMHAVQLIGEQNYPNNSCLCYINPYCKRLILTYLAGKGAQFPNIASDATRNGSIGTIAGVTFIESNSVTASYALVVVPKTCATWSELVPLKSVTVEDPLKSWKVRICEEGVLKVTDPKSICLIQDVQAYPSS